MSSTGVACSRVGTGHSHIVVAIAEGLCRLAGEGGRAGLRLPRPHVVPGAASVAPTTPDRANTADFSLMASTLFHCAQGTGSSIDAYPWAP